MASHALGRLATELATRRRRAYPIIALAVALPRLVVLVEQRGAILVPFTFGEKSDDIARTYLASGTFGFIPGHPSAYTQPLYSFFLIPLYWSLGRSWEVVGGAQILVAIATSLIVYEIGRRWLPAWAGAVRRPARQPASVLALARRPRQPRDPRRPARGRHLRALARAARAPLRRSSPLALGVVFGLAILSNVRLTALPLLVGGALPVVLATEPARPSPCSAWCSPSAPSCSRRG